MSKEMFTQQEIAPEIQPTTDLPIVVSGTDFSQPVESEKTNGFKETKSAKNAKIRKLRKALSTYELAIIGVLTGVGIVLNLFSSVLPRIDFFGRCSLIYSYCLICGVLLGAVKGGICAAIADTIVAIIAAEGGQNWMPLITISNFFMAFNAGIIYRISKQNLNLTLILSSVVSFVICTLGFSALGEVLIYNYYPTGKAYYPSITLLLSQYNIPVYIAFVIRKSITQPFWILLNLIIAKLILKSSVVQKEFSRYKR